MASPIPGKKYLKKGNDVMVPGGGGGDLYVPGGGNFDESTGQPKLAVDPFPKGGPKLAVDPNPRIAANQRSIRVSNQAKRAWAVEKRYGQF